VVFARVADFSYLYAVSSSLRKYEFVLLSTRQLKDTLFHAGWQI
jgi:hypothetical protein